MADLVTRLAAACLAVTFAWAAAYKILRFAKWRSALEPYELPGPVRAIALVGVPLAELAVTALIVAGSVSAGAAFSLSLLASFSAALLRARKLRGDRLPCGCLGESKERDYRVLLLRNALLALAASLILLLNTGSAAQVPPGELLPAALALAGIMLIGWMTVQAGTALRKK
jgi:methylamine utilization protein MauE